MTQSIVPHRDKIQHWELVLAWLKKNGISKNIFFNHLVKETAIQIHRDPDLTRIEVVITLQDHLPE